MYKKTLFATGLLFTASSLCAADIENSNLQVNFESAHIQGAGNQITMMRVPIVNKETGVGQLYDMTAVFAVDKNGNLIFKNVNTVKSVSFGNANDIIPGHYIDNKNCRWDIDGPSIGASGRLSWSLVSKNKYDDDNEGCSNNYKYVGQVLSGPLENNELVVGHVAYDDMLKKTSNFIYGVKDGDDVISVNQSGKLITILEYSNSGTPYNQWILTPASVKEAVK